MPIRTGKSVGSQNIAKGGVNQFVLTGNIAINSTLTGDWLRCPGLPKLTVVANQTGGTNGLLLVFHVAARVGQAGVLRPIQVGPQILLNPAGGTSTVIEVNIPVEAMRITLTNDAAAPDVATCTFLISASG